MEKGFFASLFDTSFSSFVTPKLIKVLFILLLAILGLMYLIIGIAILQASDDAGDALLWFFLLGPLLILLYTLIYRVVLELIMVIFRIYESSRDQAAILRQAFPEASAAVPEPGALRPQTHLEEPQPPAFPSDQP